MVALGSLAINYPALHTSHDGAQERLREVHRRTTQAGFVRDVRLTERRTKPLLLCPHPSVNFTPDAVVGIKSGDRLGNSVARMLAFAFAAFPYLDFVAGGVVALQNNEP